MASSRSLSDNESTTVDMSTSSRNLDYSTTKRRSIARIKERKGRRSVRIKDLPADKQEKARMYDINHDGELDEAEITMMNYDVDGDGHYTIQEIHAIIKDLLRDRNSISNMRKIIIGLTLFVFILSLSNLGTSVASALLVKETTADKGTAEMKIVGTSDVMGTQASAETFQALEMDVKTRRARRALVVKSLRTNPLGEHVHRRLAKNIDCFGKNCNNDIKFDVNYMKQSEVENIKAKCDQGRFVNVKRNFPGGSVDSKSLCSPGTTVIVKKKNNMKNPYMKGPKKKKQKKGFDMIVKRDGVETNFDCDGKSCFMSGSGLLNSHGEPCNLNHGSDDCESGLMCIQSEEDLRRGTCSSFWDDASWYVNYETKTCVQNCDDGPNCGGWASNWEEQFPDYKLCCGTIMSDLSRGYKECVPNIRFYFGEGRDCTGRPSICKGTYTCKERKGDKKGRLFCA